MEKENMPQGFSRFSWMLVGFCLPILLWPLALLISPNLLKNPNLSDSQSTWMSVALWIYPFVLGIAARVLFKLNQRNETVAKKSLLISAVVFYAVLFYVAAVGFN